MATNEQINATVDKPSYEDVAFFEWDKDKKEWAFNSVLSDS